MLEESNHVEDGRPADTPQVHRERTTQEFRLSAFDMLRYEVTSSVAIELTEGVAELFGTELIRGQKLPLSPGHRGTILTFHGCQLTVYGTGVATFPTTAEDDQDLPLVYLNIHSGLERLREEATKEKKRGPRLLICGQESCGKSTLCRILVNYAARKKHHPVLIDLNVGLSQVCIPGTLCAQVISKPYDLVEGWGLQEDPLVMSFGHLDLGENLALFDCQARRLADWVGMRTENDEPVFVGGCIINMCGYRRGEMDDNGTADDKGLQAIRIAVDAFEVDIVIVIEDGFLYSGLQTLLQDANVHLWRVPKSNGVHTRTPEQWDRQRDNRITAYFHGDAYHTLLNTPASSHHLATNLTAVPPSLRILQPHQVTWKNSMFEVYKLGCEAIPDVLLPHGESADEESRTKPLRVKLSKDLVNRTLAISQAEDLENLVDSTVYGFVVVLSVSEERGVTTFLSPSNAPEPPSTYLLLTDFRHVDPDRVL